jgi:hypothetical protein
MAIVLTSTTGTVALGSDAATNERGFLVKMINRTGHTSIKGEVVGPSTSADREVVLEDAGFDPIGVVQEAGVAEGSEMWVWVCGSICQVLMKNATAAVRGYVGLADDVDGRAYVVAVPSSNPVVAEHFREIGHCLQSVAQGTNVLALFSIHFN